MAQIIWSRGCSVELLLDVPQILLDLLISYHNLYYYSRWPSFLICEKIIVKYLAIYFQVIRADIHRYTKAMIVNVRICSKNLFLDCLSKMGPTFRKRDIQLIVLHNITFAIFAFCRAIIMYIVVALHVYTGYYLLHTSQKKSAALWGFPAHCFQWSIVCHLIIECKQINARGVKELTIKVVNYWTLTMQLQTIHYENTVISLFSNINNQQFSSKKFW